MSFKRFLNSHFVFGNKNHISFFQGSSFRFAVITIKLLICSFLIFIFISIFSSPFPQPNPVVFSGRTKIRKNNEECLILHVFNSSEHLILHVSGYSERLILQVSVSFSLFYAKILWHRVYRRQDNAWIVSFICQKPDSGAKSA